ncbi:magnesium transporter [Enterobacterales bacterium CwR94]|nr:magnesium transporter [Enterobacterales bacterium CwR94]
MTPKHFRLPQTDAHLRQGGWLRLSITQQEHLIAHQHEHQIDLTSARGRAATEENGFVIIPVELVVLQDNRYQETTVVFALSSTVLISLEHNVHLHAFDHVSQQWMEKLLQGEPSSPAAILFTLLETLNDTAHATLREISARLDGLSETVAVASGGYAMSKRQAGVADIAGTAIALGEAEELVAKTVEGQLMLARAGRWLRRVSEDADFVKQLPVLLSDIQSLRRYARFQHDKIRNLQQSLMTTMDIKQNQVVKVFTVVTAVFTPPTLVAAFYGQNFAYMPELELPWGEWMVMGLTGLFALMPLAYIKRKGWMR